MSVEATFIAAGRARRLVWLTEPSGRYRLVWLTEPSGRYRLVEPYMVFHSSTGKRLLHLYQVGGYSAGSILRGWKNPEVSVFDSAEMLEETWVPRGDYNPFNEEMFPEVVFAVPTHDGRVRAADVE